MQHEVEQMNTIRNWVVGLTVVALLGVGVVALAGNGFGGSESTAPFQAAAGTCLNERDHDGDGILNMDDDDWARPLNGSGYGQKYANGQGLTGERPLDGSGFGGRRGGGNGLRDGSCA